MAAFKDACFNVIFTEYRPRSPEQFIENSLPIIMRVSSLRSTEKDLTKTSVTKCTEGLYRELFSWAMENNKISLLNNALLVHLGLIKSEDKKFKPNWNIEQCLFVLENIVQQNYVPESTRDTIKVFMGSNVFREITNNPIYLKAKASLLSTLNKSTNNVVT